MRLLFILLFLVASPAFASPAFAQEHPIAGGDLGSGRVDGVSALDLGSGRLVDFEPAREAVLSDEQMAIVKEDRSYAALFQVTGDNTVRAARGYTLYASTDRDGGCSEEGPCIILIGDLLYVPFSGEGGPGITREGSGSQFMEQETEVVFRFLMPRQLTVNDEQAEVIGQGPMADHLRIGDGSVTGGR
ncbi:MAG: hypothetical protein AAFV01_07250, partial [Bacteroidota bacterium]